MHSSFSVVGRNQFGEVQPERPIVTSDETRAAWAREHLEVFKARVDLLLAEVPMFRRGELERKQVERCIVAMQARMSEALALCDDLAQTSAYCCCS